jgi:hypothetical protein
MAPVGELLRRPERTHSIDFLTVAIFRQLKFFSLAREADEPGPKHLRCELFCPRRHVRHADLVWLAQFIFAANGAYVRRRERTNARNQRAPCVNAQM